MEDRPLSEHLHYAIANGDVNTVQQLLTKGVDANQRFYIDEEILETASRKSVGSLRQSVNSIKLLKCKEEINDEKKDLEIENLDKKKNFEPQLQSLDELLTNLDDIVDEKQHLIPIPSIKTTSPSNDNIAGTVKDELVTVNTESVINNDESAMIENYDAKITEPILCNDNPEEIPKRQSQFKILKIEMKSRSNTEESFLSLTKSRSNTETETDNKSEKTESRYSIENLNTNKEEEVGYKRKSLADIIDEKLNDNNEILIERRSSLENETENATMVTSTPNNIDENQNKLIPKIKKKLSFKFTRKQPRTEKEKDLDEEDSYINFGPKVRNVDDEQLNENFDGVAFFEAVREGMGMIVQTLLETSNNFQLNLPDEEGFTPVMQAAWHGKSDILQILLDHGADTSLKNATGCTAAHFAAGQGHTECIEILAKDQLVDLNCQTKYGATPLILAAKGGFTDTVNLLLEYGADPNILYRGKQNTVLFAAGNGHYECLQSLLRHKSDVNQANTQNVTPLMRAIQQGHNDCVLLLTENKADVNIQDLYGRTAAHFAVEHGNSKALKILLDAGVDLDLKTKGGNTIQAYTERFQNQKCAELLENYMNKIKEQKLLNQDKNNSNNTNNKKEKRKQKENDKKEEKTVKCMKLSCIFRKKNKECNVE